MTEQRLEAGTLIEYDFSVCRVILTTWKWKRINFFKSIPVRDQILIQNLSTKDLTWIRNEDWVSQGGKRYVSGS